MLIYIHLENLDIENSFYKIFFLNVFHFKNISELTDFTEQILDVYIFFIYKISKYSAHVFKLLPCFFLIQNGV